MSPLAPPWRLDAETVAAIVEGRHGDPSAVLGPHPVADGIVLRAFAPGAETLEIRALDGTLLGELELRHPAGFFEGLLGAPSTPFAYRLRARRGPWSWELEDPYRFAPLGSEGELAPLWDAPIRPWERLGAHPCVHEGVAGVAFAVWAPRASRVAVVGDFNGWDLRTHPMRRRGLGIWELFVPGVTAGSRYRFAIRDEVGRLLPLRGDPFAIATAADGAPVVRAPPGPLRHDAAWRAARSFDLWSERPMAVLELSLQSWLAPGSGDTLAARSEALVTTARDLGFTHLALSAGEEPGSEPGEGRGLGPPFAPLLSGEALEGLARLVEAAHAASLGVIVDFCLPSADPAALGLARFDGAPLFEPAEGRGWDLTRVEVARYLAANARFLLEVFQLDGLRLRRLAAADHEAAVGFVRALTDELARDVPATLLIAGALPFASGLTRPSSERGLGFAFAENTDFSRALAAFCAPDGEVRDGAFEALALARAHAFAERFLLPLRFRAEAFAPVSSPGDPTARAAVLRAALGYAWGHPGKKLFVWDAPIAADPAAPAAPERAAILRLLAALNRLYRDFPALHRLDGDPGGLSWIDLDEDPALAAWLRLGWPGDTPVLVVANLGSRHFRELVVGVPRAGSWRLVLSTQAREFGGTFEPAGLALRAESEPRHGRPFSLRLELPPLSVLFLAWEGAG